MPEYHDDRTLTKVYGALGAAGLTLEQATDAVNEMQNAGILFRERAATPVEPHARLTPEAYVQTPVGRIRIHDTFVNTVTRRRYTVVGFDKDGTIHAHGLIGRPLERISLGMNVWTPDGPWQLEDGPTIPAPADDGFPGDLPDGHPDKPLPILAVGTRVLDTSTGQRYVVLEQREPNRVTMTRDTITPVGYTMTLDFSAFTKGSFRVIENEVPGDYPNPDSAELAPTPKEN